MGPFATSSIPGAKCGPIALEDMGVLVSLAPSPRLAPC